MESRRQKHEAALARQRETTAVLQHAVQVLSETEETAAITAETLVEQREVRSARGSDISF
jgi:hypothetical protein